MTERTGGAEFLGEIKEPYAKCSGCPVITLSFSGGSQPKPADQLPLVGGEDHSFPKGPEALMLWESPGLHLQEGGVQRLHWGGSSWISECPKLVPSKHGGWLFLAPLLCSGDGGLGALRVHYSISRTWVCIARAESGSIHLMESLADVPQKWGLRDVSFLVGTCALGSLHLLRHEPCTWPQFPHTGRWMQMQVSSRTCAGIPESLTSRGS